MHRTTRKRQAKGHNMNAMISAPPLDQAALWNGPAGQAWIDSQMLLDELFAPFADHLAESIGLAGASRILDIGRSEEHTSELQSLMRISYAVLCLKNKHN